jgi:hypothetical protein
MLAASMSFFEKPRKGSRSKLGSFSCASVTPSDFRKSAPSVHWLKTNLMSKAEARPLDLGSILSSVKPLAAASTG